MNWAEWRASAIAALGSELGTYTDANGATTPAIAVDPPYIAGRSVSGLEVVVVTDEDVVYSPRFGSYHLESRHRIILKQWEPNKTTTAALSLLLPLLHPDPIIGTRVPANSSLGNIETQSITFLEVK